MESTRVEAVLVMAQSSWLDPGEEGGGIDCADAAVIRVSKFIPALVCLNETFLDKSIGEVPLEGYSLVARRD